MSEAWSQWQGQLIDGKFHLTQYLGGSGASAVFVAQLYSPDGRGSLADQRPVALRLIANCENAELQLSRWRMVQGIEHPHLIRLLDTGRCRLGDIDLIYAVMEYGEESVAQILPERPLTVEETREILAPALEALTYLHNRGMVHGHVKPANIMAIADQLKLSSDGICPADQPVSSAETFDELAAQPESLTPLESGLYDAPETAGGVWSPAADVWSLGITIAEVLTQSVPSQDELNQPGSDPLLPANLPAEFVEIVRGCLRRDLELRWTIPAIKTRLAADRSRAAAISLVTSAGVASVSSAAAALNTHKPAVAKESTKSFGAQVAGSHPAVALGTIAGSARGVASVSVGNQGTSSIGPSKPTRNSGESAAASITFAQALRAKPVSSEKVSMPQERMAAVAAGASVITAPLLQSSVHTEVIRIVDSDLQEDKTESRVAEPTSKLNIIEEDEQPGLNRVLGQVRALTTGIAEFSSSAIFKLRRLSSQTRERFEQKAVPTRDLIRRIASRTEDFLGLYPGRTMMRFAVAVAVVAGAIVALYIGLESLRPKPPAHVKHEAKTPVNVVVVKPEKKEPSKKHTSAVPAKPQPGTPVVSAPQARTQPAAPAAQQSRPETASAQSGSQPPAQSAQQPAVPQSDRTQSGLRRIDDGGAEESASARQQGIGATAAAQPVGIAQQVMPQVSQSALHTIHGTVRVSVRVKLDPSGNVARAELASAGPSRYFARKSLEAAQNWKFAPGQSSPYVVHFEYRNNGARAFATRVGS